MLYALSWFFVFALLTVWSVCVWVVNAVVSWSMTGVGILAGQTQQLDGMALPEWIYTWVSTDVGLTIKTGLVSVLPLLESILFTLPAAVPWLGLLAWIVWGIGFFILGVGGLLLHAFISLARKTTVA